MEIFLRTFLKNKTKSFLLFLLFKKLKSAFAFKQTKTVQQKKGPIVY